MNKMNFLRSVLATVAVFGMAIPQVGIAAQPVAYQIPISQQIENIRMSGHDSFRGAIVDPSGKPIAGEVVAIGQFGKVVAETTTNSEGQFEFNSIDAGVYQIASLANSQNIRLWNKTDATPAGTKDGVVHVMSNDVVRGQCQDECAPNQCPPSQCRQGPFNGNGPIVRALSNPLLIAGVVVGAIAIGVAVSQDDDAS